MIRLMSANAHRLGLSKRCASKPGLARGATSRSDYETLRRQKLIHMSCTISRRSDCIPYNASAAMSSLSRHQA
jgi:hypothetical protein